MSSADRVGRVLVSVVLLIVLTPCIAATGGLLADDDVALAVPSFACTALFCWLLAAVWSGWDER